MIVRAYGVGLYSSSINTEARKPIGVLRTLPSQSWSLEVIYYIPYIVEYPPMDWFILSFML